MPTEKQKKNRFAIATNDMHEMRMIRRKLEGITSSDIDRIRRTFEKRLQHEGLTRMDWLRQRGMVSDEPTVSKVLHGKATSGRILTEIVDYIIS